jgi:LPS-assembly protein
LSDVVGRVEAAPSPWVYLLYRFRADKDSFANRRSEFAGQFGPDLFRVGINYFFVKQGNPTDPTFGDREELFVALSSRLTQSWSLNANHRENLSPGGGRIRTALGFTYEDECFVFGLDIADDKTQDRDFQSGLSVLLRFSLKTLGALTLNTNVGAAR